MPKALQEQIGGDHYKKGIQPFQLSLANDHDGCIHAIQKYLTRHGRVSPGKGYEALQKAHHICMIRVETTDEFGVLAPRREMIGIDEYVRSNDLFGLNAQIVRMVESWHTDVGTDHLQRAEAIRACIRDMAEATFPDYYNREDFI
jgi:hypothetical protein